MNIDAARILASPAVADAARPTRPGENTAVVVDEDGQPVGQGDYELLSTLVKVRSVGLRHDAAPGPQSILLVHVVRPRIIFA